MSDILYEHPLNERIRNYLKLEQLFVQARSSLDQDISSGFALFFNSIFAILDTLDRTDTRGDVIKDLERLEQNLLLWSKSPNIDNRALTRNLEQAKLFATRLRSKQTVLADIKNDKFLYSMRKRFAMQNAYCFFDLPALAFWLKQPPILLQQDIEKWLAALSLFEKSISLILKFIRQKADFVDITCPTSFYQDNGEGLLLLRIKLAEGEDIFPSISGNKYRYSIRFMQLCPEKGQQYVSKDINFKLAKC
ncbi:cell division protein ZapD [Thalassotalea aquiviva]|uniref:cell division protein ZapD n=1 Tax=Thalassotalea aquiviva TaxID=3242415 RepID=UPI00352B1D8C